MKELDDLLAGYLEREYDTAPADVQAAFARLLELQDPDLYALVTGRTAASDPAIHDVVARIRRSAVH